MTREGWQSAIIQYRLYIGMMPLRLRGRLKTSRLVEAARELAIGIVFELGGDDRPLRSEEHTSELQSLMRLSYAVFCLNKYIFIFVCFFNLHLSLVFIILF